MSKKEMAAGLCARFLLAAFAASGVFCVCAEDPVPVEPTERIELFNGKDLTNWYKFIKGRGRNCDPKGVFSVVDNKPIPGVTPGAIDGSEFVPGPILLLGDHSNASFRNMILTPIVK